MHIRYDTEEKAFLALKAGREEGLSYFFDLYYSSLVYFSHSIIKNDPAAEDIVSESFIKLWQIRSTIQEAGKLKALLFKIVRNHSIDLLRQNKSGRVISITRNIEEKGIEKNIVDQITEAETYHRLHLLISNLPDKCRQIFLMFYFEDKAIKEIAEELGISVNTVKSQKQRAMELLKAGAKGIGWVWVMIQGLGL